MILKYNHTPSLNINSIFIQDKKQFIIKITQNHDSIGGQCYFMYYLNNHNEKIFINKSGIFSYVNREFTFIEN